MIQFKKEDIEKKETRELITDFHESRFHHENYISLAIEVLIERGITRSVLFEKKVTQDLVNAVCFDSDKHKHQYLQLVKEELENRNYDVSSIPDIKNPETFSSVINARDKEIPSSLRTNHTLSDSTKTTFEGKMSSNDSYENNSRRGEHDDSQYSTSTSSESNKTQESTLYSPQKQSSSNKNKYIGLSAAAVIMLVIKLGLMYVRNQSTEKQSQSTAQESLNNEKIPDYYEFKSETINSLFNTDGVLNQRLLSCKKLLDEIKAEGNELSEEGREKLIEMERLEMSKILSNLDNDTSYIYKTYGSTKISELKHEITDRYFLELNKLLDSK